jgi:hypothetical protein
LGAYFKANPLAVSQEINFLAEVAAPTKICQSIKPSSLATLPHPIIPETLLAQAPAPAFAMRTRWSVTALQEKGDRILISSEGFRHKVYFCIHTAIKLIFKDFFLEI